MTFFPWTDIESFHNVRKSTAKFPELCGTASRVQYRPKVKLHGTNAAIQCHRDGTVVAQSRGGVVTPENDNMGFARWVKENESFWSNKTGMVFYGEWCGRGVQPGVALSQIPKRCFAVFAAVAMDENSPVLCVNHPLFLAEPSELRIFCEGQADTYVLPWAEPIITVDWSQPHESFAPVLDVVNKHVEAIEACDPWVEATFGIKGTGEGLVFYPVSDEHRGSYEIFSNLCFKAKGAAHRVVAAPQAISVDPQKAAGAVQFAAMVLPPARLEQGATVVNGVAGKYEKKATGQFVQWILADCQKEVQDELEASGLTWDDVSRPIQEHARKWYLAH